MLASSPSPSSAALRSGSSPQPTASSSSPPPSSRPSTSSHHEHASLPHRSFNPHSSVTATHSSFVGSRLAQGIEELRSALTRHTVGATASSSSSPSCSSSSFPGPSGDQHRSTIPAGLATDGTGICTTSDPVTPRQSSPPATNPPAPAPAPVPVPVPAPATTTAAAAADASLVHPMPTTGPNEHNNPDSIVANAAPRGRPLDSSPEGSQSKKLRPAKPAVKSLPQRYELADSRDIVVLISSMLMELIRFNDKIPLHQGRLTRFHSRSPPRISVYDYLQRLTTHATLSPPILLSMVYYIDRLCALYPAFTVSSLTIHRFLIASATVASKGLSDSFWTNKTYARVGGISVAELALLELEFLFRVEWRIVPQPEVLVDYYQSLVERCEGYEIQRDGNGDEDVPAAPVSMDAV